jgi:hypothetical protein
MKYFGMELVTSDAMPRNTLIVGPPIPVDILLVSEQDREKWIQDHKTEFAVIVGLKE